MRKDDERSLHYKDESRFCIMSVAISAEREIEPDTLQKIFQRPFFLSFTIGIPFCIFKLLFGITAIRIGAPNNLFLDIFGWIVVFWALGDLLINISRGILDLMHRPISFEYCIIAQAGEFFTKTDAFSLCRYSARIFHCLFHALVVLDCQTFALRIVPVVFCNNFESDQPFPGECV